ncbi:5'-methylthioadenosine phosphorylase [Caloramator quimbayensis]|uniref:Purine nucleoside phosphorylase n=1 Tax=Caloramator quimbayensis TaxID=1147123 RepID=A0A1T4WKU8_9CLOT|nr:MTAP family purine nucleoside phosphorylase [Caloramator quimbayensis]SKA77528.1 5'-methylthioadenosine phosphorylase [Caloramator quimbayensis]
MDKAIIGGTGVYDIGNSTSMEVDTIYGKAYVDIVNVDGEKIVFLARHGKGHSNPPHLINYRANMKALEQLGVKYVYATAAVGSCNENYSVGDVVVIKDFIDFTKSRPNTFYEGGETGVVHTDMSEPYCRNLISKFYDEAKKLSIDIKGEAVYCCTEGPRFETASEIRMYKSLGADVVGMTNVPEVVLSKELGMCYSAVGIITNFCTGIGGDIELHDIEGAMNKNKEAVTKAFINVFKGELNQNNCKCKDSRIRL